MIFSINAFVLVLEVRNEFPSMTLGRIATSILYFGESNLSKEIVVLKGAPPPPPQDTPLQS